MCMPIFETAVSNYLVPEFFDEILTASLEIKKIMDDDGDDGDEDYKNSTKYLDAI